jgi:hypothetical protein
MNTDSSYDTSQNNSGWFSWLKPSTPSSTPPSTYVDPNKPKAWYHFWGGKRRKSRRLINRRRKVSGRRRLIGGSTALPNTDINIASTASPIKGIYTAQPHNITRGGKRRKGKSRRKYRC